jgi:hypothetical protein
MRKTGLLFPLRAQRHTTSVHLARDRLSGDRRRRTGVAMDVVAQNHRLIFCARGRGASGCSLLRMSRARSIASTTDLVPTSCSRLNSTTYASSSTATSTSQRACRSRVISDLSSDNSVGWYSGIVCITLSGVVLGDRHRPIRAQAVANLKIRARNRVQSARRDARVPRT